MINESTLGSCFRLRTSCNGHRLSPLALQDGCPRNAPISLQTYLQPTRKGQSTPTLLFHACACLVVHTVGHRHSVLSKTFRQLRAQNADTSSQPFTLVRVSIEELCLGHHATVNDFHLSRSKTAHVPWVRVQETHNSFVTLALVRVSIEALGIAQLWCAWAHLATVNDFHLSRSKTAHVPWVCVQETHTSFVKKACVMPNFGVLGPILQRSTTFTSRGARQPMFLGSVFKKRTPPLLMMVRPAHEHLQLLSYHHQHHYHTITVQVVGYGHKWTLFVVILLLPQQQQ